jgi:hypothetical protein
LSDRITSPGDRWIPLPQRVGACDLADSSIPVIPSDPGRPAGSPPPVRRRHPVLLDQLLAEAGIVPATVTGPEAESHLEIAMSVASGQADTGLAVRAAATALGLSFVPLAWEDFDIVLSGDALPAAEPLISALRPGRAVIYLRARRLRHVPRGLGGNAGLITRLGRG